MASCLLLGGIAIFAAGPFECHRLEGPSVRGHLAAWTAGEVVLDTPAGEVTVNTADVLRLEPAEPPETGAAPLRVHLLDGSVIAATAFETEEGRAKVTTASGPLEFPTRDLAAVRLQPLADAVRDAWDRLHGQPPAADLLAVVRDEALDYHQGVVGRVSDEVVEFSLDGERLPVPRSRVFGLVYHRPAGRALPEAVCLLADADGSRWAVRSVILDGDRLRWETPAGISVTRPVGNVLLADYAAGRVVDLGDLTPQSVEWTPFIGSGPPLPTRAAFFAPRSHRGGERTLVLGGEIYDRGLAVHSRTEIVYRLPGDFRRFQALAGIDDRASPLGGVRLSIRGDDAVLFDAPIRAGDPPQEIDVSLEGVRRLVLLVDYGEESDVGDHLNLCEARLVK